MLNYIKKNLVVSSLGFILAIVIIGGVFNIIDTNKHISSLDGRIQTLETALSSTTEELRGTIASTHDSLSDALAREKENVENVTDKLRDYRREVGDVSDTVDTLQKLQKIDPELLAKYSKVFFLNENYAPARLAEIPNQYKYSDSKILKLIPEVEAYLEEMFDDAKKAKVEMYAQSSFRSFNEQQALKGQYTTIYGAGTANSFAADQGYSEHQLGTTLDIIAPGQGGVLDGFENTPAYTWLTTNAYKYGFVLSYPKNNGFYVFEPWHWRFVGVKLATDLHKQKKTFYDLDQRDIDEYLVNLFD